MSGVLPSALVLFLAILTEGPAPIEAGTADHDMARLRWSGLEFRASKLTVTATSEVEIRTEPVSQAADRWLDPSKGRPIMPQGPQVVTVSVGSEVLGKTSELDLWLDPGSAAAIQRTQLETGRKIRHNRHRSLRFAERGVFTSTYRASEETVAKPFEDWALTEEYESFPESTARQVVTEPTALFYLLAVADLDEKGDRLDTFVFSKGHVMRVVLEVVGTTELKVSYTEASEEGQKEIKGRRPVVRIQLTGSPVGSDGTAKDFEFLGLRGDVEIFLEPTRRIPVQISGNIRFVGRGHVRLQRVRLR